MFVKLLILLALFKPQKDIVIPHTGITKIQNACSGKGLLLMIDNEWAYYKQIGKNVFVRRDINDSLFCKDTSIQKAFKFDLDGDGKFEKISYKKNTLRITNYRLKTETYRNVLSFAFYDADNNGTPDLFYTDTNKTLHFLRNTKSNKNFSFVKSRELYTILYFTKRKKYTITVHPALLEGIIPLTGWEKTILKYKNSTIEISKGMVINTEKLASPIEYVDFINDTLKISFNLSHNVTYNISIIGKDTVKVAEGTLPKGAYRFEYYVGPLKKGTYKVKLSINKKDFFADFVVK